MRDAGESRGTGGGAAGDRSPAGRHGPAADFLALAEEPFVDALSAHLRRCMGLGPDGLQLTAWRNEFAVLKWPSAPPSPKSPTQ